MYGCNRCGQTGTAAPSRTADAMNAMAAIARSAPVFDLGVLLNEVGNRSATGLPEDLCVQRLIHHIALIDLQLCKLMSSTSPLRREVDTEHAENLVASMEAPRRAVACHAANTLRDSLCAYHPGHRPLDREQLKQCIHHAGLLRVVSRLPVSDLSEPQRRDIANVLIDIGTHAGTTGNLLGLAPASLHKDNPVALRERLMTERERSALEDRTPGKTASPNRRAEAYQRAVLVGERFGYPAHQPPWTLVKGPLTCPRTRMLLDLAGSREAQRRGIDVHLS